MTQYRKWLYGGLAVAVLVFVLGFLLIVSPAKNNAAAIEKQAREQEQQNLSNAARIDQYRKQSSEVPAKLAEIGEVQKKLPPRLQMSELVRAIEAQAQKAGVQLKSITPGKPLPYTEPGSKKAPAAGVPIVAIPLSVQAVGSYATIKSFVNGLERMERAYFMSTINVDSGGEESVDLSVDLTGQVFSVPAKSIGVPTATPQPTAPSNPSATPNPSSSAAPSGSAAPPVSPAPSPATTQTGQAAAKLDRAVAAAKKKNPTSVKQVAKARAKKSSS